MPSPTPTTFSTSEATTIPVPLFETQGQVEVTATALSQAESRRAAALQALAEADDALARLQSSQAEALMPFAEQDVPPGMVRTTCDACGVAMFSRSIPELQGIRQGAMTTHYVADRRERQDIRCAHCYLQRAISKLNQAGLLTPSSSSRFKMADFEAANFDGGVIVASKTVTGIGATPWRPEFHAALAEHFSKEVPGQGRLVWTEVVGISRGNLERPWERHSWSGEGIRIATVAYTAHATDPRKAQPMTLVTSVRDPFTPPKHLI